MNINTLAALGLGVTGALVWAALRKSQSCIDRCLRAYIAPLIDDAACSAAPDPAIIAIAFDLPQSAHRFWAPGRLQQHLDKWGAKGLAPKLEAERVAKIIADALDSGALALDPETCREIEQDEIAELAALSRLALEAGPAQGNRLLRHLEAHLDRLDEFDVILDRYEAET